MIYDSDSICLENMHSSYELYQTIEGPIRRSFVVDQGRPETKDEMLRFDIVILITLWYWFVRGVKFIPPDTSIPRKYSISQEICTRFLLAVLCCGYTLTDCPSASKATLMNMDKYFMWIHYEHNHNKAKHNKTVCIFLGIYCMYTD